MPCYRCGARQGDPAPGKPSPWHQGVVARPPAGQHQVLICPACFPSAQPELARCPRCGGSRLVKRLDQVECLTCHLTRDTPVPATATSPPAPTPLGASAPPGVLTQPDAPLGPDAPAQPGRDPALAAEVAAALDRVLRDKWPPLS